MKKPLLLTSSLWKKFTYGVPLLPVLNHLASFLCPHTLSVGSVVINYWFAMIDLVTSHTESYGTVVGTHYHKFCQHFRKGCGFRQYYGYSSEGSQSITFHDPDWEKHDYFVSSSETAFELCMLRKFDAELLLGQMSYSQKAEIYNYCNGYPVQPKKCSTLEKEELPWKRFVP